MKSRLFAFLFFFASFSAQSQESLREGDLLFLDLDCGPLCDAIEQVTTGHNNLKFSHVGLLVADSGKWKVLEAIGSKVTLTKLETFLAYSSHKALLARLKPDFQKLIPDAKKFGLLQLGQPYDDAFLPGNGKWYCSELLYEAFKSANGRNAVFELSPMTFKIPGSDRFFPAWETYYKNLGLSIPEGVPGCNPGGLSRSPKLEVPGFYP